MVVSFWVELYLKKFFNDHNHFLSYKFMQVSHLIEQFEFLWEHMLNTLLSDVTKVTKLNLLY